MAFKIGKEIGIGTTGKLFDLLYLMEFHSAPMHQGLPAYFQWSSFLVYVL